MIKLVIFIGLLIIFISTFFILFIFTTLMRANLQCLGTPENPQAIKCDIKKYGVDLIVSLMMVGMFLLVDIGAVYMMLSSWVA